MLIKLSKYELRRIRTEVMPIESELKQSKN